MANCEGLVKIGSQGGKPTAAKKLGEKAKC